MRNTIPKNIIVRMPNWIGDLVMATPVLADLRLTFPKSEITVMCKSNVAKTLVHDPNINKIINYKTSDGYIKAIRTLRENRYDLGLLLTNSLSSAWLFFCGRVKNKIGFADNLRSWMLNRALPYPKNKETQHQVITYKHLLHPLKIPVSNTQPKLYISKEEKNSAQQILKNHGIDTAKHKVVGINPGAAYGTAKCWLPDRFEEVARLLTSDTNTFVLFFGDTKTKPLVDDICAKLPNQVVNLSGKTSLRELISLINSCDVLLTNDSGPMHIAYACQTPLVALFGSTSDVKTGPLSGKVIHKRVECSPCYKRVCPIDFRCMKRIEVEEVYQELKSVLHPR